MDTSILHDYDPITDTCVTWLFAEDTTSVGIIPKIQLQFFMQFSYLPPSIRRITSKKYRPSRYLAGPVVGEAHDV